MTSPAEEIRRQLRKALGQTKFSDEMIAGSRNSARNPPWPYGGRQDRFFLETVEAPRTHCISRRTGGTASNGSAAAPWRSLQIPSY